MQSLRPLAKAGSHMKLKSSWAKPLLCYYTVLLQEEEPDEFQKPVFILISPHTHPESQFTYH